jgi:hypothetical protein
MYLVFAVARYPHGRWQRDLVLAVVFLVAAPLAWERRRE